MLIKLFIPFQMSDASLELPQEKKDFSKIRSCSIRNKCLTETGIGLVLKRLLPNGDPVRHHRLLPFPRRATKI